MFKKMKLNSKLISSFAIVAIITLIVGMVGWIGTNQLIGSIRVLGEEKLPKTDTLLTIAKYHAVIDSSENALLSPELSWDEREAEYAQIAKSWEMINKAFEEYENLPRTARETQLWNQFKQAWSEWQRDHERYVSISRDFLIIEF